MSLPRTPLDPATLSAAAQRALGPGPGRTMAARGLVPLAPADQLAVLYQLGLDPETAEAAAATAAGLPERLLAGALADPALDPRVLDYFAATAARRPAVLEALLLNPSVADETVAALAARADPPTADRIAQNERRLLRHPAIIAALYLNPRARKSTVDRAVELAVRNQIQVPGLAAWEEIARSLEGGTPPATAEQEAAFAAAAESLSGDDAELTAEGNDDAARRVAEAPDKKPALDKLFLLGVNDKIRLASLGNAFARAALIKDPIRVVAMAVIKSPAISPVEATRFAGNHGLNEEVIEYIAKRPAWTKDYKCKLALCHNPRTPPQTAAKLLPFLNDRDLKTLASSHGISSALVAQAKRLVLQRVSGKKGG